MTDEAQTSGLSPEGRVTETADAGGHRLAYGLLIIGLMAFSMGQTVLFAVLGPIAREIDLRETHVGVIVTCSAIAVMVSSAFWGKMADRWGRRPVFVLGLGGYALSTFAFAGFLHAGLEDLMLPMAVFTALIATRVAYGLIASSVQPAAFAYVADITSEENRSSGMAALGAAFGIGSILGPVMGAGLAGFGLVVPILAAATLALILAVMAWFFLAEPARGHGEKPPVVKVTDIRLRPIILLTLAVFSSFAIIQQTTAFYIQDKFALTPQDTATTVGLMVGGLAFSMLLAQAVIVQVFKPSPGVLIRAGLPLGAAGALAVLWAPDMPWSMAAFAVFGLGFGLLFPGINSAASVRVRADEQGAALGIVSAAMAGGFVLGPLLGTWLYEQTASWPLMLVATLSALSWFATFVMQLGQPDKDT